MESLPIEPEKWIPKTSFLKLVLPACNPAYSVRQAILGTRLWGTHVGRGSGHWVKVLRAPMCFPLPKQISGCPMALVEAAGEFGNSMARG